MADQNELRAQVAVVAAAYFSSTHVNPPDIPSVVNLIATSLGAVGIQAPAVAVAVEEPAQKKATPTQIRKSITDATLISFEDGKAYKTLKRHLTTRGLTIEAYREKWGLPKDYPSVAPSYSAARSQMAKALGLGQTGPRAKGKAAAPTAKNSVGRRSAKAPSAEA